MPVGFRTAPLSPANEEHPFGKGPKPFVLTDVAISDMATSTNQTRRDGKERGFRYCIDPGQRAKGVSTKFNVLETAPRCIGNECSVTLSDDKECPPVQISWDMGAEVAQWLSPGQDYGSHHTHPSGDPTPSPQDIVAELLSAVLYQKKNLLGCVTGSTGTKGVEQEVYDEANPDALDPTLCWVIPPAQLPDVDELMVVLEDYNKNLKPMYAEWSRTGKMPDHNLKKWSKALEAYENMDMFGDSIKAEVHFASLDDLYQANVRRQQTGVGDERGYFDVQQVELVDKRYNWAPGWVPVEQQYQDPDTGELFTKKKTTKAPQAPQIKQSRSFEEEFGSLENCIRGVFPGGGKMSNAQFKRIAKANGIDESKTKRQICEELSGLETMIHA